ncbi:transposase family protein [Richelia intracellularis]|nr:transposase family protein [Richelia intracellularis]
MGLNTEAGRLITNFGTNPIGIMQWKRDNFYLYGLLEPLTGKYFIWELSHLNAACFQIFLENKLLLIPKIYTLFS